MFDYVKDRQTHMPFINDTSKGKMACYCVKTNDTWKAVLESIDRFDFIGIVNEPNSTECSPFVEENPITNEINVSFIAGGLTYDKKFYLYSRSDIFGKNILTKVIESEIGLCTKNKVIYGGRATPIYIANENQTISVALKNVMYIYRVTINQSSPNELIISYSDLNDKLHTIILNPYSEYCYEMLVKNEAPYKACLYNGICYYAKKCGKMFEDRKIESSISLDMKKNNFNDTVIVNYNNRSILSEYFN